MIHLTHYIIDIGHSSQSLDQCKIVVQTKSKCN